MWQPKFCNFCFQKNFSASWRRMPHHLSKFLWKKIRCVLGRRVEVKLLCNFFKIPEICNVIPNEEALLNRLSSTRSYEYDLFTVSCYTSFSPPFFSLTHSKPVWKTTPVYTNENCLQWWTAMASNANQWTNWFHFQQN